MRFYVRPKNVEITRKLRAHLESKIFFGFDQFENHVRSISVVLEDINGPRGGEDKVCRIRLHPKDGALMVLEGRDFHLFAAISKAADRLSEVFGRTLQKKQMRKRKGLNKIQAAEEKWVD